MNDIDISKSPLPIDVAATPSKPQSLSDRLRSMFPEIDLFYIDSPARLLELKLLRDRYLGRSIEEVTSDPEEIQIFSAAMQEAVRQRIVKARTGNPVEAYQSAQLMAQVFADAFTYRSWFRNRSRLLGEEQCKVIGDEVVKTANFTRDEAEAIMAKHKNEYDRQKTI